MNVAELKKLLEGVPGDMHVVISSSETDDAIEAGQTLVWLDTNILGKHTPYWAMTDPAADQAPGLVFQISSTPIGSLQEMKDHLQTRPGSLSESEYEAMMRESEEAGDWMQDQLRARRSSSDPEQ